MRQPAGIYFLSRRPLSCDRSEESPMKALLVVFLIGLLGCGVNPHRSTTISGINTAPSSVSGFVNAIRLATSPTSLGTNSLVTVVTFIPQLPQNTPPATLTFCGNVASQFLPNTFATVQFTPALGCSTLVSLVPASFVSISGTVSIVQLTNSLNNSPITKVTFLLLAPQSGFSETLVFCGNVAGQFVVNGRMTVSFTQGQACSDLVSVLPV